MRLTKRLSDGYAVLACENCERHEKGCTALYCRNRLKNALAEYEDIDAAKPSSRSLGLLPCPVCHRLPHLRFWGDSDYYFECHIARKPLEPQEHFPTVQEAANAWNENVRYIKKILKDVDSEPVVRCKDCRNSYEGIDGRICSFGPCVDCVVPDDFFCSLGERGESCD